MQKITMAARGRKGVLGREDSCEAKRETLPRGKGERVPMALRRAATRRPGVSREGTSALTFDVEQFKFVTSVAYARPRDREE